MVDYDKKNWREEEKKQGLKELKQLKEIVGFLLDQQQRYYYLLKNKNYPDFTDEENYKKAIEYKSIIDNFTKF